MTLTCEASLGTQGSLKNSLVSGDSIIDRPIV